MLVARTVMLAALTVVLFPGCQNYYYDTVTMLGPAKWDVFEERVIAVRNGAAETRDLFAVTGQILEALPKLREGQFQAGLGELTAAAEESASRSEKFQARIEAAANTSDLLFRAWEDDLQSYPNQKFRDIAAAKLNQVRTAYFPFIVAQRSPLGDFAAVLDPLREQISFLSSYPGPDVLRATQAERAAIAADIRKLVPKLAEAVRQADMFIGVISKQ